MGAIVNPSANFTRPADTTTYASGDLVANSTTAGSVTPLTLAVGWSQFKLLGARLKKSSTSISNVSFRLHLYSASPTVANGDNGAFSSTHSGYLGHITFDPSYCVAFSDAVGSFGTPITNSSQAPHDKRIALVSGTTIYGLLEARAAYSPASEEVFTVTLEIEGTG